MTAVKFKEYSLWCVYAQVGLGLTMNNSLAEVHPELVSEWSEENLPLTPYDITFGSNEKVW